MLVLAILIGGMIFSAFRGYWEDFWISRDGKPATATIIAKKSHGVYDYQFMVGGIQYVGHGQRGRNLDREAHIGGQTPVYLSSSHPWLSSPQMPTFSLWNPLVVIALLFSIEFFVVKAFITSGNRTHMKSV
jgi:hypothetical protein